MRLEALEALAKRLTGQDVWVGLVDLPDSMLGSASQPARGLYAVKLSTALPDRGDKAFSFVFYHECGHIALSHVPVKNDSRWYEYAPLAHEVFRERREREANDFAEKMLNEMGVIDMSIIENTKTGRSAWASDWGLAHTAQRYAGRDDVTVTIAGCGNGYLSECHYDGVNGYQIKLDPVLFSGRKSLLGREFWRAVAGIKSRLIGVDWGYGVAYDSVNKAFFSEAARELDARFIEATAQGHRLEVDFLARVGKSTTFDALALRRK